jgi:hypothetical protein
MLPLTVSHVCRAWRDLALRTPSLWKGIYLDTRRDMWEERMARAKACPLDVKLLPVVITADGNPRRRIFDFNLVQWHMHWAVPHIHRWRSLEIVFLDYAPFLWNAALSLCCSPPRIHVPLIEEVTFIYRGNDDPTEFCLFSGSAPRLHRLTIDGIRLTWLPSLFQNLTYLNYTHHGFTTGHDAIHELLGMLRITTNLIELSLLFPRKRLNGLPPNLGSSNRPRRTWPVSPVNLLHLRILRVDVTTNDIPHDLVYLMTAINNPRLTKLILQDSTRKSYPFQSTITFFRMYRLPSSLRSLTLQYGWCYPTIVNPLLRRLRHLQEVIILEPQNYMRRR